MRISGFEIIYDYSPSTVITEKIKNGARDERIISRLNAVSAESTAAAIQQAIFEKNTDHLQQSVASYLTESISVYDTGSEAFYQGLMIGLCAILNHRYAVRSNREAGLGCFDIQLAPMDRNLPGFIFELKASKKEAEGLDTLAAKALKQIKEKQYITEMKAVGISEIVLIGIAFRGKEVALISESCDEC